MALKTKLLAGVALGGLIALTALGLGNQRAPSLYVDIPAFSLSTDLVFNVYATNDVTVPVANWPLWTNFAAVPSNLVATVNGTNTYKLDLPRSAAGLFFVTTSSNALWGESNPSSVAPVGPLPPQPSQRIR